MTCLTRDSCSRSAGVSSSSISARWADAASPSSSDATIASTRCCLSNRRLVRTTHDVNDGHTRRRRGPHTTSTGTAHDVNEDRPRRQWGPPTKSMGSLTTPMASTTSMRTTHDFNGDHPRRQRGPPTTSTRTTHDVNGTIHDVNGTTHDVTHDFNEDHPRRQRGAN